MNRTKIDWPGLTHTWNPIVGCANGCDYCYARKISNRFKMIPEWEKPQFFPERLGEPCKMKKPAVIFVGSMCDIFSIGVEREWIHCIIETVKKCPQHTFMFLTKKPEGYGRFTWPENCIHGVTIEKSSQIHRFLSLSVSSKNKKFVSIEPIHGELSQWNFGFAYLLIIGRDTNQGAPIPPAEWIASIQHTNIHYKKNITDIYPQFKNKLLT